MPAVAAQPKKKLVPFRYGTRRRIRQVNSVAYSSGADLAPIKMPEVGFLSALIIEVSGTMNVSGSPGVLVDKGPWNLLKRIKFDVNLGTSNIVDVSGFGAFLVASDLKRGFGPSGGGNNTPISSVYAAPVVNGNNTWKLMYYIPIAANDWDAFDTGLINLQAPEVQANLNITCGTTADVFSSGAGTGFTGTITVHQVYYDVPDPKQVAWPLTQVVRTVEEATPILVTGDFTYYQILRQGTLLELISVVRCNGALSEAFDQLQFRLNKSDYVEQRNKSAAGFLNQYANSIVPPTGVFFWQFWNAMGQPQGGDLRDTFNTEKVTTMEAGVLITSGTTLGSNNNDFSNIRRVLVNLNRKG